MNEASQILVIILSAALAVFLVLGIMLLVMLIRLSKQIKKTATSIAHTTESVEGLVTNIAKIVSPAIVAKSIKEVFDKFKPGKTNKKEKKR
ncbi:MAG: hypothetical protein LBG75_01440 [Candidatus Nomurabacteria bacterium]|jgi:uncharacterized protein YoxC|nr:hypothetical protein [Candidatus Nomurabacteria bacterium]